MVRKPGSLSTPRVQHLATMAVDLGFRGNRVAIRSPRLLREKLPFHGRVCQCPMQANPIGGRTRGERPGVENMGSLALHLGEIDDSETRTSAWLKWEKKSSRVQLDMGTELDQIVWLWIPTLRLFHVFLDAISGHQRQSGNNATLYDRCLGWISNLLARSLERTVMLGTLMWAETNFFPLKPSGTPLHMVGETGDDSESRLLPLWHLICLTGKCHDPSCHPISQPCEHKGPHDLLAQASPPEEDGIEDFCRFESWLTHQILVMKMRDSTASLVKADFSTWHPISQGT